MLNEDDELTLSFLFADRRAARNARKFEQAREISNEICDLLRGYEENSVGKEWSRLYYGLAYIENLLGNAQQSIHYFQLSADYASKANDLIRQIYGEYHVYLMKYLSGLETSTDAYDFYIDIENKLSNLLTKSSIELSLTANLQNFLLRRLCELSFEVGGAGFERWRNRYDQDPLTLQHKGLSEPSYQLETLRNDARSAFLEGDYDMAAITFCSYLSIDPSLVPANSEVSNIVDIKEFLIGLAGEAARDYRDAGRTLLLSSIDGRYDKAEQIFRMGLGLDAAVDNHRFLIDIRNDLRSMDRQ